MLRLRLFGLTALAACTAPVVHGEPSEHTDLVAHTDVVAHTDAPLQPLQFVGPVPSALVVDATATLFVQGGTPGRRVTFMGAPELTHVDPDCIVGTVYTCSALLHADVVGEVLVESGSLATLSLRAAPSLPNPIFLQAHNEADDRWTPPLELRVLPPDGDEDEDGLTNLAEVQQHQTDPLLADTDGDGLNDGTEVSIGSDPTLADTDGDGTSDGTEVIQGLIPGSDDLDQDGLSNAEEAALGTNPRHADSDRDGIRDGDELDLNTDPLNADTDGDGVADGEELRLGIHPLDVDSDDDGLEDGAELTLGTDPSEPDTDGDHLDDGAEVARGTAPLLPDTDADGVSDGDEVRGWQTDPLRVDTDGDGLSDGDEAAGRTSPILADTDTDGISDSDEQFTTLTDPILYDSDGGGRSDGEEVQRGTDPNDPTDDVPGTCAPGTVLDCLGRCTANTLGDGACDLAFACDDHADDHGDCPTATRVITGDVVIPSTHSVADLVDVVAIDGALWITDAARGDVALHHLEQVERLVLPRGHNPGGASIVLPRLHTITVAMDLILDVSQHPVVSLPALTSTGGATLEIGPTASGLDLSAWTTASHVSIRAGSEGGATTLELPLHHISQLLTIEASASNTHIRLPQLTESPRVNVGIDYMQVAPHDVTFDMPNLHTAGSVRIDMDHATPGEDLAHVDLSGLIEADSLVVLGTSVDIDLNRLELVKGAATLEARDGILRLDSLEQTGPLTLQGRDLDVMMPALHTVTHLRILHARGPVGWFEASFPSLVQAAIVSIDLDMGSVDLPELTAVEHGYTVLHRVDGHTYTPKLDRVAYGSVRLGGTSSIDLSLLRDGGDVMDLLVADSAQVLVPSLVTVGSLTARSASVQTWSWPALTTVRSLTVSHPASLNGGWPFASPKPLLHEQATVALELPALTQLGELEISHLTAFQRIDAPLVDGDTVFAVHLERLHSLSSANLILDRLVHAAVTLKDVGLTDTVSLAALEQSSDIHITALPEATSLAFPRLTTLGGALRINNQELLASIDVPSLRFLGSEGTFIYDNPSLVDLDLSTVEHVGGQAPDLVQISSNPQLNECALLQWAAPFGSSVFIADNDPC